MAVFQTLGSQLSFCFQDLRLGGSESIVETTQDRQRENDVLVLTLCDGTVEILSDFPKETGDSANILGVVGHG